MTRSHKIGGCLIEWQEVDGQLVTTISGQFHPQGTQIAVEVAKRLAWCHKHMPRSVKNGDERAYLRIQSLDGDFPDIAVDNALPLDKGLLRSIICAELATTEAESLARWSRIKDLYS